MKAKGIYMKSKNHEFDSTYTKLMCEIKKNNYDYLCARKSKEYRIGKEIVQSLEMISSLKFSNLFKEIKLWTIEKKIRMMRFPKPELIINNSEESNFFSENRIAIYTAIFGKYDQIIEPRVYPDNCDYFIITDLDIPDASKWKKMDISKYTDQIKNLTNAEKNRFFKILPHLVFSDYDYSVYVDGNIEIMADLTEYIYNLNSCGIGLHLHSTRKCVFDEAKAILIHGKDSRENIERHIQHLKSEGMPANYGMCECNVIVRDHSNEVCKKIMIDWWNEFKQYAKRDQISFPYALYKNNINISDVAVLGNNIKMNPSFRVIRHE